MLGGVILRFINFSLLNRAVTVVTVSRSFYPCFLIPEGASLSPSLILWHVTLPSHFSFSSFTPWVVPESQASKVLGIHCFRFFFQFTSSNCLYVSLNFLLASGTERRASSWLRQGCVVCYRGNATERRSMKVGTNAPMSSSSPLPASVSAMFGVSFEHASKESKSGHDGTLHKPLRCLLLAYTLSQTMPATWSSFPYLPLTKHLHKSAILTSCVTHFIFIGENSLIHKVTEIPATC